MKYRLRHLHYSWLCPCLYGSTLLIEHEQRAIRGRIKANTITGSPCRTQAPFNKYSSVLPSVWNVSLCWAALNIFFPFSSDEDEWDCVCGGHPEGESGSFNVQVAVVSPQAHIIKTYSSKHLNCLYPNTAPCRVYAVKDKYMCVYLIEAFNHKHLIDWLVSIIYFSVVIYSFVCPCRKWPAHGLLSWQRYTYLAKINPLSSLPQPR